MKLTTHRNVTSTLTGERHDITIAANGKAFTTLVRGLYSDKIRAFVREITTNALDSHVEAGIADTPFHVSFPDVFDPYFRVRDYGVSMDHDTVFGIFGTLFGGSKDQSNDAVGAFGLGSKSPLSYSDSFNVTAYLDGVVRVYFVSIDETGAPSLTLLSTEETDKPNGIEVAVPIKENDFARVISTGREVLAAFNVAPTTNGVEVEPMKRLHTTTDGSAFVSGNGGGYSSACVAVRQGCVIYPLDDYDINRDARSNLNYGYRLILDVPIGTVGVVPSREALELDEETREVLTSMVSNAMASIEAEINGRFEAHPNRLAAIRDYVENGVDDFWSARVSYKGERLNDWINLEGKNRSHKPKAQVKNSERLALVKSGNKRGLDYFRMVRYPNVAHIKFVIDRPNVKVVRAGLRYREFVNENGADYTYMLTNPSSIVVERLMRVAGFKRDQFIWIGDLPDPGRTERGTRRATAAAITGVTNTDGGTIKELPEDYYWLEFSRPNDWNRRDFRNKRAEAIKYGADPLPLLIFTPSANKRYKPEDAKNITVVKKAAMEDQRESLAETFMQWHKWGSVGNVIREAFDVEPPAYDEWQAAANFFTYEERAELEEKAKEEMEKYHNKYPLLFDSNNIEHIKSYIAAVEDSQENP